jgi:GAF domain-containing protein
MASFEETMNRLPGWVTRHRQATLSKDMTQDPRAVGMSPLVASLFAGRPTAIAPIIADNAVLGTLTVLKSQNAPEFTEVDLSLVRMLAMQAAVAIRNAGLYEELRASRDNVQAAHEDLKDAQTQLLAAQKLEAIGSLAAGIAHEINTPIQFVSDNTNFIKESLTAMYTVAEARGTFLKKIEDREEFAEDIAALRALWEEKTPTS